MTQQNTQVPRPASRSALRLPRVDLWTAGAIAIALVVLAPMASVLWIAFHPTENIWPHLIATVLPRYLGNTLILMIGVAVLTAMVGTGAAWLTTMYRFPGGTGWIMCCCFRWRSRPMSGPMRSWISCNMPALCKPLCAV